MAAGSFWIESMFRPHGRRGEGDGGGIKQRIKQACVSVLVRLFPMCSVGTGGPSAKQFELQVASGLTLWFACRTCLAAAGIAPPGRFATGLFRRGKSLQDDAEGPSFRACVFAFASSLGAAALALGLLACHVSAARGQVAGLLGGQVREGTLARRGGGTGDGKAERRAA